MSIFAYQTYEKNLSGDASLVAVGSPGVPIGTPHYFFDDWCPYCRTKCYVVQSQTSEGEEVAACSRCGWWSWRTGEWLNYNFIVNVRSARAILSNFADDSDCVPYAALSQYVTKHPDKIENISPSKCEELVAAVFRDVLGYRIESCSYGQHDLGIDIVAIRADLTDPIAIQVKRYKRPVELSLIHQFCGAMVDSGYRKGYFVTTGSFRRGCDGVIQRLRLRGQIEIDLVHGRRFLEFLRILNDKHVQEVYCPLWGQSEESRSGVPDDPRCWISLLPRKGSNKTSEGDV